ncbi:hypothetical protein [Macrococcus equipercicus]|uniref:Uncharacterized protein n=1 Tax=Macrococcus equipercicus TaxID=69967 RepID=A0A9Q9F0M7_9STAP|nr:hypothetical protein [Macrococcus equipercicus]UTH13017.1 hypothetical protein KFV11_06965 [Macrococcus equipercicus]
MKEVFTVEKYLTTLRELYKSEENEVLKKQWLNLGLALKQMIDSNEVLLFDKADDDFQKALFERLDSS